MMRGLTSLGLGAGLMYFFDPARGRARRARLRDQFIHWANEAECAVETVARDLSHRASGMVCETVSLFSSGEAPDKTIEARVRSALGRVCSHPRAVKVEVRNGGVILSGPVLASEMENIVARARSTRGARGVENRLEAHQHPGDHPALQGGRARPGERSELMQERWSPSAQLLVGLAGAALAMKAMKHPKLTALAALGTGLAAASAMASGPRSSSPSRPMTTTAEPSPEIAEWASP
jgi:hypothetical protein